MKCDAKFFGLKRIPEINISKEKLEELAEKSTSHGITVTGVQKKLSLHLSEEGSSRLTLVDHPSGYILKPQTEEFEKLPEAEDMVMDIAELMGVRTVPHGLVEIEDELAYITKRVDRRNGEIFAMEDFCQLSGRLTEDKYKGSYERCAAIIKQYSTLRGFDMSEFFLRLVVCFITGNSDMHLKNFSLIERNPGSRDFVLSPAYDLLPVNLIMPEDPEETALTLNGSKRKLKLNDFSELAKSLELPEKTSQGIIKSVIEKKNGAIDICQKSYLSDDMKEAFISLMEERLNRLE